MHTVYVGCMCSIQFMNCVYLIDWLLLSMVIPRSTFLVRLPQLAAVSGRVLLGVLACCYVLG